MKFRNRILACLLASAAAFAGIVSSVASAQTDTAPAVVKGKGTVATFVVYRNAAGEVACRVATPAEHRRIMEAGPGDGLHFFYKGAPRTRKNGVIVESNAVGDYRSKVGANSSTSSTSAATTTPTQSALLPSAGLHIFLHGTSQLDQNQAAKDAFIVAANRWEALISTPINVVIDVDYGPTWFGQAYGDTHILGQTASRQISTAFSNVRQRLIANSPTSAELSLYNALPASTVPVEGDGGTSATASSVVMTRANARALGFVPNISDPNTIVSGGGDAKIGFNSTFGDGTGKFDFNPDDGITAGTIDFDAVVTHEIGHALGFVSDSGAGETNPLSIWDVFRFRPGAANLSTLATAQRVMTKGDTQVFFDAQTHTVKGVSTQELGLSTGGPEPTATDGDGNQSSHWKDDSLVAGRPYIGIMDPTIPAGVRNLITDNDTNALDAFGYSIGGTVAPPPPPPPGPANDNFVNAVAIQSVAGGVMGTNQNATLEAGEPTHQFPSGASVWYNWTSPTTGTATFDTVGSDYDTTLAAYTGPAVNQLSLIIENDDIDTNAGNIRSRITFSTQAGTTYRIQVDGYDGDTGNIVLNWTSAGVAPTPTPTPTPVTTPALVTGRVLVGTQPLQGVAAGIFLQPSGTLIHQTFTGNDGRWNFAGSDIVVGQTYSVTLYRPGYNLTTTNLSFTVTQPTQDTGDIQATKGNDIDDTTFFVTQHYRDFLGREPDASGLGFWTGQIESCGINLGCREAKRINVSAAFFLSIEHQNTGYLVERMYKAAYGDATEASTGLVVPIIKRQEFLADIPVIRNNLIVGQDGWQAQLETNKNAYALAFVQRQRFIDAFPASMSPAAFVDKLIANVGGGIVDATERTNLINELAGNNTSAGRASVLRKVAEDADLDSREKNRAFVLMQYFGYLQRNPSDAPELNLNYAGWNFWLGKLNDNGGDFVKAEMVKAFLSSDEYRNRFVN